MKDYLKVFAIAVVGGIIAIVIYPFFHETGHMIATLVFGGNVKEFHVFPTAYVVCDINKASIFGRIMIGVSGMLFPFLLSSLAQPKSFWGWYMCFITRGICVLSFAISLYAIAAFRLGSEIPNEDIVQVLKMDHKNNVLYFCVFLLLMSSEFILIARSHPIRQCKNYFNIK